MVRTVMAVWARFVGAAAKIVEAGGGVVGFGALRVWVAKKLTVRVLLGVSVVSVVKGSAVFVLAVPRRIQRAPRRVPACPPCYGHRCALPR